MCLEFGAQEAWTPCWWGLFKVDRGYHMRVWQLHNWVASGELSETRNAAQHPPTRGMAPLWQSYLRAQPLPRAGLEGAFPELSKAV